jgi:predicted permease
MEWLTSVWLRIKALRNRRQLERDLADELRFHREMRQASYRAEGLEPEEAHDAARRRFGNATSLAEACRELWTFASAEAFARDVKYAVRTLARRPGFTAAAALMLALGVGANTAIFSFFNGILLRPLPYDSPESIVLVKKSAGNLAEPTGTDVGIFAADFVDLKAQTRTLDAMATYTLDAATLERHGTPELVVSAVVTSNFFSVLGSRAAVGRAFSEDDVANAPGRLAILSHAYWQSRFGGDARIVGKSITLNGIPFTIVGVMPPEFDFPREANLWATPAEIVPEDAIGQARRDFAGRGNYLRTVVGRLRPGVPRDVAEQELAQLVERLPNPNDIKRSVHLVDMQQQSIGKIRPALAMLLGSAVLVLLIACLNVANLTLTRATSRRREIGIRLAIGASRSRIGRQLLIESLLLAVLGGSVGIALSRAVLDMLVRFAPDETPRLAMVQLDGHVLAFAFVMSLATGVLSGLATVLGAVTSAAVASISAVERGPAAGSVTRRLRDALVVGEVALALVLLTAAGLLLRSFANTREFAWGFDPSHIVSVRVAFLDARYNDDASKRTFERRLLRSLEDVPAFESVGVSLDRIGTTWLHLPFTPDGHEYPTRKDRPQASYHLVSHDYLRTLGIPILQGRTFTATDDERSRRVVVVDAALARQYFHDTQAVGRRVQLSVFGDGEWAEIVGVAAPVKTDGPASGEFPDLYLPYLQAPLNSFFVHVRTSMTAARAGALIEERVHSIDSGLPLYGLASMDEVTALPADARRFPLGLLGAFAGLAVLLASLGVYGVVAYTVAQRTGEIGVRIALGAQARDVLGLVLGQGLRLVLGGVAIGAVAAVALRSFVASQLYGVTASDPLTFVAAATVLGLVAFAACWLPARRAARVDPAVSLRYE